jgi:hypothetical protein
LGDGLRMACKQLVASGLVRWRAVLKWAHIPCIAAILVITAGLIIIAFHSPCQWLLQIAMQQHICTTSMVHCAYLLTAPVAVEERQTDVEHLHSIRNTELLTFGQ